MVDVNTIGLGAPLRWLAQGWRDMMNALVPSLLYGAAIALASFAIWRALIASDLAFWALSLSCGFVFVAPMLAMGLYEAGRRISNHEQLRLAQMVLVRSAVRADVFYLGLALLLIYLLWGRIAQVVYGLSTYRLHTNVQDFVDFSTQTSEGLTMLVTGTIVGGGMAFFTFSITVVSAPMLLDQKANVFEAMFTSIRAVAKNFAPMLLWAVLITLLLVASAATSWLGLIVVFPWLGLASWRAYCDVVPDRTAAEPAR
ncbi:MAG: DUF2189 domain-containing protein [Hyphomonadaceae bacterium]|nr:DUF2189 domain-containing protein [Hyphomonadaceae bacterium]